MRWLTILLFGFLGCGNIPNGVPQRVTIPQARESCTIALPGDAFDVMVRLVRIDRDTGFTELEETWAGQELCSLGCLDQLCLVECGTCMLDLVAAVYDE